MFFAVCLTSLGFCIGTPCLVFFVLGEGTTQRVNNLAVIALYRGGKRMLMAKKDCCNISLSFLALLDN